MEVIADPGGVHAIRRQGEGQGIPQKRVLKLPTARYVSRSKLREARELLSYWPGSPLTAVTRSPLSRVFGALLALWLVVFTTGGASLHACPMHDGVGASTAGHGASSHGAPAHGASMHHGDQDAPAPGATHHCKCPGQCCTVAPIDLPRVDGAVAATIVAVRDPGLPDHAYVSVYRSLLLPFANGPPRA